VEAGASTPNQATKPQATGARDAASSQTDAQPTSGDGELERILEMVAKGDLSARDAEELLRAMGRV